MADFEELEKRLQEGVFGSDMTRTDAFLNNAMADAASAIRHLRQERDEEREEIKKARASWHARRDDLGREIASQRAVIAELKEALREIADAQPAEESLTLRPDWLQSIARSALARLENKPDEIQDEAQV